MSDPPSGAIGVAIVKLRASLATAYEDLEEALVRIGALIDDLG